MTIGNYDGLHLGHVKVLERAIAEARQDGAPVLAVTFRPHPGAVLSDSGAPERLTSDAQQRELFDALGVAGLLVQPFDVAFARVTAEDFYRRFLRRELGARGVAVGATFRFGAHRHGDVALLSSLAAGEGSLGPRIVGVDPVIVGGEVVSSSRVRRLVGDGLVEEARRLLDRPFIVEGRVVRGDGRGRELGHPTANVAPTEVMVPGTGVYATMMRRDDEVLPCVTNVGRRPTFGPRAVSVEAHVLDFSATLYGETVRLAFLHRIRDEQRFGSAEELVAQIQRDVATARTLLAPTPPSSFSGISGF